MVWKETKLFMFSASITTTQACQCLSSLEPCNIKLLLRARTQTIIQWFYTFVSATYIETSHYRAIKSQMPIKKTLSGYIFPQTASSDTAGLQARLKLDKMKLTRVQTMLKYCTHCAVTTQKYRNRLLMKGEKMQIRIQKICFTNISIPQSAYKPQALSFCVTQACNKLTYSIVGTLSRYIKSVW